MATANPMGKNPDIFETVEQQIMVTFESFIGQIIARRDMLLEEIRKLKMGFEENLKSQKTTLEDLDKFCVQLQEISRKENTTSNFLQLSLAPIEKQISDIKASLIQSPNIQFLCQTQIIEDMIRDLGKLDFEGEMVGYTSKHKATRLIDVINVYNIHIDDTHLYLGGNQVITTYETTNWELKGTYEFKKTTINAIATTKNHCYTISKTLSSYEYEYVPYMIKKFTKDTFQLIKKQRTAGGSKSRSCLFKSLAVSSEDELFVVDQNNHRICAFDSNLFYRRDFGNESLKFPILIQIKENRVIIKDSSKELHLFNKQGDHLGNLPEYGDISGIRWFCFDSRNNMIFSFKNSIRIISQKGELLHVLGSENKGKEDLTRCSAIAVYKDSIIVACLKCVKIF